MSDVSSKQSNCSIVSMEIMQYAYLWALIKSSASTPDTEDAVCRSLEYWWRELTNLFELNNRIPRNRPLSWCSWPNLWSRRLHNSWITSRKYLIRDIFLSLDNRINILRFTVSVRKDEAARKPSEVSFKCLTFYSWDIFFVPSLLSLFMCYCCCLLRI